MPYQKPPFRARVDNGNEGVLRIPLSPSIAGTSPLDSLVSYQGYTLSGGVLPLCREAVGVFYSPCLWGRRRRIILVNLLTFALNIVIKTSFSSPVMIVLRNGLVFSFERRLVAMDMQSSLYFSIKIWGSQTPSLLTFLIFLKWL